MKKIKTHVSLVVGAMLAILSVSAYSVTCNFEAMYMPAAWTYGDTSTCPTACTVTVVEPHDTRCGTATVPYAFCSMQGPYGEYGTQYDGVGSVYQGDCKWDSFYGWSCVNLESEPSSYSYNESYAYPYTFGYDAELCPE